MNRKFILILLSVVAAIALLVFAVACGRTVTVTFDEGGATKTVSVKSGSVVQDYTPQKDGYEFSCWTERKAARSLIFRSR
ncbi:MAG: InlB B-repeat-containing protein [Christensenellales bacterium]